ncbi:styrene monooxygenase/indole monooxygenase family protein [Actinocatenispora comari]|uniref:Alanine-phosphoribitol ligase n=1 Tax=Actinocatenispora comari TaxID=2807577 RepID=A0A8J4EL52_9ACTN|nr:styrene monooxygenase/indole monooxygenase family protein [Actinocatenispora comari]GIL28116.1 alanine-phosphoribitol ligase [Actinocatenispora comari]
MPHILIVGAGQSGLQLGLNLLAAGMDVTIMSARTPEEIRGGSPTSTQCMFQPALQIERDLGLNFWEEQCPKLTAQRYNLGLPPDGYPDARQTTGEAAPPWLRTEVTPFTRAIRFTGPWEHYTQSVDQRIKMSSWLAEFENRGGTVIYQGVMTSDLDSLTALGRYDLTIVAAGKGELVGLFDRDASRSPYDRPQRALSCIYTRGMTFDPEYQDWAVSFANIAGVGEFFNMPGLTVDGDGMQPCNILLFAGFPEGPLGFHAWRERLSPTEHLDRIVRAMREYVPWEADLAGDIEITDPRPSLIGGYTPTVRHPIGHLPSGGLVLGMGDVVVANDPITGQGANNAAHSAHIYARHIIDNADGRYDEAWMQATFDDYWNYAKHPTVFTNAMLGQEPPEHVGRILAAAQAGHEAGKPVIAARIAYGYTTPSDLGWMLDPDEANKYLAEVAPEFATPAPANP